MITGASQADAAVLVVDIVEGVKEQTRRHAYLLGLLGFRSVIVAMNKVDLLEEATAYDRFKQVYEDILLILKGLDIDVSWCIPIAAVDGTNVVYPRELPWLTASPPTLLEALNAVHVPDRADAAFRMVIQGVHDGVSMGQVLAGQADAGDCIAAFPEGEIVTLEEMPEAKPISAGEPAAIVSTILPTRGSVLAKAPLPHVSTVVEGNVFWIGRGVMWSQRLVMKCATQEIPCQVFSIEKVVDTHTLEMIEQEACELAEGQAAEMTFLLSRPIVYEEFDILPELGRFTLELDGEVVGAGIFR
jgi:sulfate adenylyltransferase subunit 1 (EFTu-like GTPase family)